MATRASGSSVSVLWSKVCRVQPPGQVSSESAKSRVPRSMGRQGRKRLRRMSAPPGAEARTGSVVESVAACAGPTVAQKADTIAKRVKRDAMSSPPFRRNKKLLERETNAADGVV